MVLPIRDTDYKPQRNIPLRSPLAFGGFILHYLRTRFDAAFEPPYVWLPNETETELFITSGNTIENEIRNNRPAIYVNVGPIREGSIVLNDRVNDEWFRTKKDSYSRLDMGITINCESDNKGESHNLGWFVFTSLVAAKDIIRTKYQIANFGGIELMSPRPTKEDRETYVTSINFGIQYEFTWNVTAVQTVIRELDLSLENLTEGDPNNYFNRIYISSIGTTTHP